MKYEFKVYGQTADSINEGDRIFVTKVDSVEGRKVVTLGVYA